MKRGTHTPTPQGEALSTNTLQTDQARLLYSYPEARKLLGDVPQSTFAMWIAQGIVVPVKIGPRRCFIRHEDILRLAGGVTLPKAG